MELLIKLFLLRERGTDINTTAFVHHNITINKNQLKTSIRLRITSKELQNRITKKEYVNCLSFVYKIA